MRSISVISLAMVVWRSSVIRRSWSQNSGSTLIGTAGGFSAAGCASSCRTICCRI